MTKKCRKTNANMKKRISQERGISLISLAVTVVVLAILTGITINAALGDKGIVEATDQTILRSDYQIVKNLLETYKLEWAVGQINGAEVTDESLIGIIYKKVIIADTKRELAVIVDFDKLGKEPDYGKGGKILLEQDNNDMTTVKEIENIYELEDVYAVDLETGMLYYINGTEVYGGEDSKVEVQENEATVTKYDVETFNQAYLERRMFKTTWNVILGEEEGSSTYSTVTLPAYTGAIYDAIIYWGDGTSTTLQHKVNGVTLTAKELAASVTHEYIVLDESDQIREIKISGTYGDFGFKNSQSNPTYQKIVGIEQWGNVSFTTVNFADCSNLGGSIPSAKIEGCFSNCTTLANLFYNCTSLTGSIPEGLFDTAENSTSFAYCFYECAGLTGEIPDGLFANKTECTNFTSVFGGCTQIGGIVPENLFKNCPKISTVYAAFEETAITEMNYNVFTNVNNGEENIIESVKYLFTDCKNLKTVPEGLFSKCNSIKYMDGIFQGCTNLETLADDFVIIEGTTTVSRMFWDCENLTSLPENFTVPEGVTNVFYMFRGCKNLTSLPVNFKIPNSVTGSMGCMFQSCEKLESLPDGVIIPEGVTGVSYMFIGCSGLEELPTNLTIPNGVTNANAMFYDCSSLKGLPADFSIPNSVENMNGMFNGCSSLNNLPDGVRISESATIITSMFSRCNSLTALPSNFSIPSSVTGSLENMFYNCINLENLPENLVIPEGVTSVKNMFYGCKSLESLPENFKIPSSVTDMYGMFRYCSMLKGNLIIEATPTTYDYCFQSTATSSGSTLTVNYTSTCTNIKDIVATGNATYVKEGSLIEEPTTEGKTSTGSKTETGTGTESGT